MAGARRGLAVTAMIGLYLGYAGQWMLAIICLAVILLILFGMLVRLASR
jgi:hypothetical protein